VTNASSAAPHVIVWGSELSPYTLKLGALLAYAERPFRLFPADGSRRENLAALLRIELAKRRRTVARYPAISTLDEYPLVPFLLSEHGVAYDSSALARWLDDLYPPSSGALVPGDPSLAFAVQLVDEAFDEFGLYLVHHARWVISARTNDAGLRLAREFGRVLLPGTGSRFAQRFAARQVRRLPYLFSVAPPEPSANGPAPELTPPQRAGFPPTHRMLAHAWEGYLDGVERIVREQPYLFGERFTLADASVYGQLGMNLKDPTAAEIMQRQAPATFRWLCAIRDGHHVGSRGALAVSTRLRGLLDAISRTFMPLMAQNAAAYDAARAGGETLFNERAFNRGRALYDGTLLGCPFRSVVKTFQVRVWRELCGAWRALDEQARIPLLRVLPPDTPLSGPPGLHGNLSQ
jgi:glutathione S-transferase